MAIKSIGRYKELDEKGFAEKFIIGTMLSFMVAICGAYLYIFIVDYFNLCSLLQDRM
jgi:uncharacterized membrane protein